MRLVVVGNAADLLVHKNGGSIDGYDRIIRINSFIIDGFEAYVGARIDIVSLCFATELVENILHHSQKEIAKASEFWTPYPQGYHKKASIDAARAHIVPAGATVRFAEQIAPEFLLKPCFDAVVDYRKKIGLVSDAYLFRPTTGLLTLLVAEAAFPNASISITGFGLNTTPSTQRVDTSGAKMWRYHDLDWERKFLMDGCKLDRWRLI